MNQQCKVCCEPAAGFHFGAFTCEGCKSFFGRTYNNLGAVTDCKNKGECVINKKNRTACKACRLKKCLMVGMSKSGSRYGRRSNWFKIHCLLEEQREKGSNFFNSPQGFYPGYPNPLLTPEKFLALHGYPRREGKSESGESSSGDAEEDIKSGHFMHAPCSSHTTPSPKHVSPFSSSLGYPASPIGANPPYSPPVTTSAIFFPPQHSPTMLQFSPKLPTTPSWTPPRIPYSVEALSGSAPRTPMGGDALLYSPTVGGVAVEQEAPIDLSLKTSVAYRPPTPRSDASESGSDDELHIDVGGSEAVTIKNNPLDLTAKRLQVPS